MQRQEDVPLPHSGAAFEFRNIIMNKTMKQAVIADQASVSRLAYELWENAGRPTGRDLEFWLAAEANVRTAVQQPVSSATEAASPAVTTKEKSTRAARPARGGIKKTWPKPYPSLPRF
jgi:Protein of unknown function (DUF2934)